MGLKDTLLGWMRQGKTADKGLEKAETDLVERDYEAQKTDGLLDSRLGKSDDQFDADQSPPR